jgi:hypothetical protein
MPYMSTRPSFKKSTKAAKKQPKPKIVQITKNAPISIGKRIYSQEAEMTSLKGGMRVRHREFCYDAVCTSAFSAYSAPINPGNADLFPWLSPIAMRFETYRFEKLSFFYESLVGTATAGIKMLAVDFDASDPLPGDKKGMMSYKSAGRCNVWDSFELKLEKSDLQKIKERNCLDATPRANQDIRLFNVGNLISGAVGNATAGPTLVGEVYVEYDVILSTPQIDSTPGEVKVTWTAPNTPTTAPFTAGNSSQTPPATADSLYSFGISAGLATAGMFAMYKAGEYLLDWYENTNTGGAATGNPVVITSLDGHATVTPSNPAGGVAWSNGSQNKTSYLLRVVETPAVFTADSTSAMAGLGIGANSTLNITPVNAAY